jgi:hypothetical protein
VTRGRNRPELDWLQNIYDSSDYAEQICICKHCGQVFLEEFRETPWAWSAHGEEIWLRWYPLTQAEQESLIRSGRPGVLSGRLRDRPYLIRSPEGDLHWVAGGQSAMDLA